MSKFESQYFDNATELVQAKDDCWKGVEDRVKTLETVRAFTNMMATLTPEEAEELGRTEITNHGLIYRDMIQQETQYTSMVSGTNSLVEIIVDTDSPEQDLVTGARLSEAINRFCIHHKGKFLNFWRKVAGEIVIAGGAKVTFGSRYGWLPTLSTNMFFPKEAELDPDKIPYAFEPVELTKDDLLKFKKQFEGSGDSSYLDAENIESLIEKLDEQIADRTKDQGSSISDETQEAVRKNSGEKSHTISAWWYYEVKYDKSGDTYVSKTLCTNGITGANIKGSEDSEAAKIVAHIDKAYSSAEEWLHLVFVDSEIGGIKNIDTLKGVAEMTYPSALETEELLNLMLEGDKIRARPKIRLTDQADPDEVKKWDVVSDLFAPRGVEEMEFKGTSRSLMTPMSMLSQNTAGLTTSSVANGPDGGELRQQALERQRNSSRLEINRITEATNHLDSILDTIVWRILDADVKPGTADYRDIMAARKRIDSYGLDRKELSRREFGRFVNIRVRAKRTVANGDRTQQLETAKWLMDNLQNYPPAVRPRIIHKATVLQTQDPDEADSLVSVPKSIINAQKITAENEYDTIRRRAALGQVLPMGEDDVHQDHIPVHLLDMQAHVASHAIRPWDKLDLVAFAGMTQHVALHIQTLMENPVTNGEGKTFMKDFQNIVQAAQAVVQEVEEATQSDQAQLTPKEQAELQLKWAQLELEGRKFGMKMEDVQRLWSSREAREKLAYRNQYTREINEDRRLRLDAARMSSEGNAQ
jgi:hypothetical protein